MIMIIVIVVQARIRLSTKNYEASLDFPTFLRARYS